MSEVEARPERSLYVGDSLMKDIQMASDAGIESALAAYGGAQHRIEYDLLRTVSHWTEEDVERERKLPGNADTVRPNVTIGQFGELLDHYEFGSCKGN